MKKWKLLLVLGIAVTIVAVIAVLLPAYAARESFKSIPTHGTIRYP